MIDRGTADDGAILRSKAKLRLGGGERDGRDRAVALTEPAMPNLTSSAPAMPAGTAQPGLPAALNRVRSAEAFEDFFVATYRLLLKQAQYAGADVHEADDAVAATMADVYRHWHRLDDPIAWARRAVVRFYLKAKARNLDRVRARQIHHRAGTPHGRTDANLTTWEEWQWIKQMLLDLLTDDQREVVALVLDGYTPVEIAGMIGATPEAIRRRLSNARRPLAEHWAERGADPSAVVEEGDTA